MTNIDATLIGRTVEFNYGPMYGSERGTVTDTISDQWGMRLIVITDNGATKYVNGFTTVGIGVYLIDNTERKINRNSPWFIPE